MIGDNKRGSLIVIIVNDVLYYSKLPLFLLIVALVSAIMVVTTTYHTRRLTTECDQMVIRKNILDVEWRNLLLEKNVLCDHSRVERIAIEKLQMQHVDPLQENIVIEP